MGCYLCITFCVGLICILITKTGKSVIKKEKKPNKIWRRKKKKPTYFYNSFFPATIRDWNNLPLVVSSAISVTCFKNALNKTDEVNTSKKNFTH